MCVVLPNIKAVSWSVLEEDEVVRSMLHLQRDDLHGLQHLHVDLLSCFILHSHTVVLEEKTRRRNLLIFITNNRPLNVWPIKFYLFMTITFAEKYKNITKSLRTSLTIRNIKKLTKIQIILTAQSEDSPRLAKSSC